MRELKRQLKGRSKTIFIWLLLIGALVFVRAKKYCSDESANDCETIAWLALGAVLVALVFLLTWRVKGRRRLPLPSSGFALHPENYHQRVIRLWGKVEYVFPDTVSEHIKRRLIDAYRSMLGDTDPTGRYLHQRFLMSSPVLHPHHQLLVIHNLKFGKEPLKRGRWVQVQGEYLHTPSVRKTGFGERTTFYGRLHYTHEPKGYLKVARRYAALGPKDSEVRTITNRS